MKKITVAMMMTLMMMMVSFTACSKNSSEEEFYPKEELSAAGVNWDELYDYKAYLAAGMVLSPDEIALEIGGRNNLGATEAFVTVYILDSNGQAVKEYIIEGDIKNDIFNAAYGPEQDEFWFNDYEWQVDGETIYINR